MTAITTVCDKWLAQAGLSQPEQCYWDSPAAASDCQGASRESYFFG